MSLLETTQDLYPSRQGGDAELLPRVDPVVWPSSVDGPNGIAGPLDAEQIRRFDEDGFLTIESLFTAEEIARYDAALDELVIDPSGTDRQRMIIEPGSDEVRSVFDLHRHDGVLADVIADERLAGVARQILGDDVYVHQSRANRKPGFRGREFQWHSDFETWHTEDGMPRMRCLSASVALTDNHTWNGPLLVMPGSHRWFVTCPEPTPPSNHERSLARQEIGVPDDESLTEFHRRFGIETCTGPAGSVTFFDCNLMHGSPSNISPLPRRNLFLVYNSVSNALEEPFAAPALRPTHLASRTITPI